MERKFIKSGIPGLDELLGGGFLEGSIITISGPTGSGKSTLAAQFIYSGATEFDEPGLYLAIEESRKDFFFHISGFSWDFDALEKERKFIFLDYPIHEVDQIVNQPTAIYEIIHNTGVKRVVIDSIMPVALYFKGDDERKKGFLKFIENLRKWGVTVMIVSEDLRMANSGARPTSEYGIESFTDGWVNIFYRYDDKSMERNRYIEVIKMKGVSHSAKSYPAHLDNDGFTIMSGKSPQEKPKAKVPEAPAKPEAKPKEESIDELVEKAFTLPKPAARPAPPPPALQAKPLTRTITIPPPPQALKPAPKSSPAEAPKAKAQKPPPKAAPKPPPAKPPSAKPPPPPPAKAPLKAAPPKAKEEERPAQKARPPPAKMSDSLAQRIAEAKKRIMKK